MKKLATFAALTLLSFQASATANWQSIESTSLMDDSPKVLLATLAKPIKLVNGKKIIPGLAISCEENKTLLYVDWGTMMS